MSKQRKTRVAALDFGAVRVGLAVSDELGMMAHPRAALDARDRGRLLRSLAELARDEDLEVWVIGLPRSLSGVEGPAARKARAFAAELGRHTGLPVDWVDERWTTTEAYARLRAGGTKERAGRKRVDSAAAAILLDTWLNAQNVEQDRADDDG